MARTLTTLDAYSLINALQEEALGAQATIQAVDASSFISVGEMILASGKENTLNALSMLIGRTMTAVRPYEAKFRLLNAINSGAYTNRIRKISYYARGAVPDGSDNTDLYTNHYQGYDNGTNSGNSTASMWEQNQPVPLEINFAGSSAWDYTLTRYLDVLEQAFTSEQSFIDFISGIMTEVGNDIEMEKEAFARMNLLNFIAGKVDLDNGVVNMTELFNDYYGTSYSSTDLRSTYFVEFLEFFVATVKTMREQMTHRNVLNHVYPEKTGYYLARHTPTSKQKMFMLSDFWNKAEAMVHSQVFHLEPIELANFEKVLYWQNINDPSAIDFTPAIPDFDSESGTYGTQIAGDEVQLDYVLGVLFDEDALMIDYQIDRVLTSPIEARKAYYNTVWHFRKNAICDFTEQGIIFIMADDTSDSEE